MANDLTPSTRNITRIYRAADSESLVSGLNWYTEAHAIASTLASKHGVTLDQAAGVIAALSPLNSWGANVNLADRFLEAGGLHAGYLGTGLAKGRRILAGESPRQVLRSAKVAAFFECIVSAGITDAVCVDRHAFDLAVGVRHAEGERPGLIGARYAAVAEAYRRAARILGVSPAQVQAVTWRAWRKRFWAEGAYDSHAVAVQRPMPILTLEGDTLKVSVLAG